MLEKVRIKIGKLNKMKQSFQTKERSNKLNKNTESANSAKYTILTPSLISKNVNLTTESEDRDEEGRLDTNNSMLDNYK